MAFYGFSSAFQKIIHVFKDTAVSHMKDARHSKHCICYNLQYI